MMMLFISLLLILVLLASWLLNWLGLPGNWLIVMVTAVYAYFVPAGSPGAIGWYTVMALLVLAVLGEILEFVAGAMGVAKLGGSRRGAVMALVGSFIGAIVGVVIGLPIPLVGSIVAAVLLASVGALIGAMLGERGHGRSFGESWRIGKGAFWGRLFGTLGKTGIGAIMIAVVVVALAF
jgi:hypothetical protein